MLRYRPTETVPTAAGPPAAAAFRLSAALLAGVASLLLLAPAAAQEPAAADPAVFGEVIDVRVVNVEVVVTDNDGVRVTGLGPEDFRLTVDGEQVPIDFFTEIRGGEAVEVETGGGRAVPGVPAAVPGEAVGTSYLVFVDDFFSIARDRNRVLDGLESDIPSLGPGDRMAVVAFDGKKVEMLTSWTSSEREINAALRQARDRPAFGLQRLAERRAQETAFAGSERSLAQSGFGRTSDLSVEERGYARQLGGQVETAVSAAVATLRGFAQPPGRRVMLLLSGGWPFSVAAYVANDPSRPMVGGEYADGADMLRPLTDTANLIGFTVYPVDVPGLGGDFGADAEQGGRTIQTFSGLPLSTQAEDRFVDNSIANSVERENLLQQALYHVAEETGGRALVNSQKLDAFSQVVADTRSYYWIGFTPERQRDDGAHDIRVEVTRSGLDARSRESFRDLSRRAESEMAVESMLLFDDTASGPLTVEVGEIAPAGRRYIEVPIRVIVPMAAFTTLPEAAGHVARLELQLAALDEDQRQSDIPTVPIELTFRQPPSAGALVPYETRLKLRRERQTLVVSVRDTQGDHTLATRVEIVP